MLSNIQLFITITFLSFISLLIGIEYPNLSIPFVTLLFCLYCALSFKSNFRFYFLLYPLLVIIIFPFYKQPFCDLGDGISYFGATRSYLPFYNGTGNVDKIFELIETINLKILYIGFIPNILIPDYLYAEPSESVYYYWQSCLHVIYVSICLVLAKKWKVLPEDYLLPLVLFAVISPSFFEIGNAPTRHFMTFFSILLFYTSINSAIKSITFSKIIILLISLILIIVSKIGYLVPVIGYSIYRILSANSINKIYKYIMVIIIVIITILLLPFFYKLLYAFNENKLGGAATFSFLVGIPILSVLSKYIYALLAPFPWQEASLFIDTIYGGNWIHFTLHVISSLTGIYFFAIIILHFKSIMRSNKEIKDLVLFGLIMSSTILVGQTGYHGYLSIFFPFFAPLFAVRNFKIPIWSTILIALLFEFVYSLAILLL